jgi:hypothetical protein
MTDQGAIDNEIVVRDFANTTSNSIQLRPQIDEKVSPITANDSPPGLENATGIVEDADTDTIPSNKTASRWGLPYSKDFDPSWIISEDLAPIAASAVTRSPMPKPVKNLRLQQQEDEASIHVRQESSTSATSAYSQYSTMGFVGSGPTPPRRQSNTSSTPSQQTQHKIPDSPADVVFPWIQHADTGNLPVIRESPNEERRLGRRFRKLWHKATSSVDLGLPLPRRSKIKENGLGIGEET